MIILYWLVELIWGALETIPGLLVALVLLLSGHKPVRNGYGFIFPIGGNWGGLSLGPVSLCGKYNDPKFSCFDLYWFEHTRRHEFGHSIQLMLLGPLHLFLVVIPSAIRYWVFRYRIAHNKPNPEYDSVWFEGTATKWGTIWIDKIEK